MNEQFNDSAGAPPSDIRPATGQMIRKKAEISLEDHPSSMWMHAVGWNFVDLEHPALDTQRLCRVTGLRGTFAVILLRAVPLASGISVVTGKLL